jgi:hypothetical protein
VLSGRQRLRTNDSSSVWQVSILDQGAYEMLAHLLGIDAYPVCKTLRSIDKSGI